jgi:hypothetical protein
VQAAETPGWVDYATAAGALVPVLAIVATVALLTGSAREYFRPRPAADDGYQHGGFFAYPAPYSTRSGGVDRSESKHAAGDPAGPSTTSSASNVTPLRDRGESVRPWDQPSAGERGEATRPWDQPSAGDRSAAPRPWDQPSAGDRSVSRPWDQPATSDRSEGQPRS